MDSESLQPTSVLRPVMVFVSVKLSAVAALTAYVMATDNEAPNLSTPVTIAAAAIGVQWFARRANRPMSMSETLKFAVGCTLADIALSLAWGLAMIWALGAPWSWEGVSAAMGGSDPQVAQTALAIGLIIGSIQVFAISGFLAWLLTKKLPKDAKLKAGFE